MSDGSVTLFHERTPFKVQSINSVNEASSSSLEKSEVVVFSLFLFLSSFAPLPFNSQIGLSGEFSSNGFLLLCLGTLLAFLSHRYNGLESILAKSFVGLTILLILINLVMSLYLYPIVGTLFGETPLSSGITTIFWLVCHAFAILYVYHCYTKIDLSTLNRVFDFMLVFVLVVCLVQAFTVAGVPGFRAMYSATNIGGWFHLADYDFDRLSGVAFEPSGMGSVISMLCFPYAASKLLFTRKLRYGLALALLLFVGYFTYSSTVYVALVFSLIAFAIAGLVTRNGRIPKGAIVATMLVLVVALIAATVASSSSELEENEIYRSITSMFEKVTDKSNASTAYRNSTVSNDIKIFEKYPIFGVGEGNQGYFYAANLDPSVLNSGSLEARNALSGKVGVLNGGSFIPALISGFGITGTIAYLVWILYGLRQAFKGRNQMGSYFQMYLMGLFGSLPMLWIGIGFSGLPVVLIIVLGMPFMADSAARVKEKKVL